MDTAMQTSGTGMQTSGNNQTPSAPVQLNQTVNQHNGTMDWEHSMNDESHDHPRIRPLGNIIVMTEQVGACNGAHESMARNGTIRVGHDGMNNGTTVRLHGHIRPCGIIGKQ